MRHFRQFCFAFLLALMPCSANAAISGKARIAFIYSEKAQLPGWSSQHDVARKALENFFKEKISVKVVENVKPGADAERIIIGLAREGNQLIFVTAPSLGPQALEAAKRFPDVYFEIAQGTSTLENVSNYDGRFYQAYYIFGQTGARLAGPAGKLGFVAEQQDARSVRALNAYALGAQNVSPDMEILVSYSQAHADASQEAAATRRVIDAGAAVLAYQTSTPAPAQIAEQNGVWVFGNGSDMAEFAPQWQVSSLIYDWSGYYIKRVQALILGTWKPADVWAGFREGIVTLGPIAHVKNEIRDAAIDTRQQFIDDHLKVFVGPLFDSTGKEQLKKDEVAGDRALKTMSWIVQGKITILSGQ